LSKTEIGTKMHCHCLHTYISFTWNNQEVNLKQQSKRNITFHYIK